MSAPSPSQPTRTTRRGERTAERILDVAESLFAERGYAGTTLRDVAGAVGLRIPSLYNHFPNKEALYAAVLARGIGPVLEMLSDLVVSGPDVDSDAVVERVMEILSRHPHLPALIQHETLAGGAHLTPMLREWIGPVFARARELVSARAGEAKSEPEEAAHLVLATYHMVVGYFATAPLYRAVAGEDLLRADAIQRQTRFLKRAVGLLIPNRTADPKPLN